MLELGYARLGLGPPGYGKVASAMSFFQAFSFFGKQQVEYVQILKYSNDIHTATQGYDPYSI